MPAERARRGASEAHRLSPDDWLDAAFDSVVAGGFDNVRVLALAQRLGVTRGSFYWHFTDHAALVDALLQRWQRRELDLIDHWEARGQEAPGDSLLSLLDVAMARPGAHFENMRFELALRDLGRSDARVASLLAQVDNRRLGLFEARFRTLTGDPRTATDLAALFYLAIVGAHQALSRPGNPPGLANYLAGVIGEYLVRRPGGLDTR